MDKRFFLFLVIALFVVNLAVSCGDDPSTSSGQATDDDDSGGPSTEDDDNAIDDDSTDDDDDNDAADDDDDDDNDDDAVDSPALLPGPGEEGYDADLEAHARKYDRTFHTIVSAGTGINMDITVNAADVEDHDLIDGFIRETDGWDFEAYSGKTAFDVVDTYHKVAGLYGGVGIGADAYRYGCLRDQGYEEDEVELARQHLLKDLEILHIATAITGIPGGIVRGLHRRDIPGYGATTETTPLFDEFGNPLPTVKSNGTWREDNSEGGLYPEWIWEDSCSRDMFLGWVTAYAASWEVIRDDPTFPEEVKDRLQADAKAILVSLSTVQESGYDLEIMDADGRTTYHGYLNENNLERIYMPWLPIKNAVYAIMALGCVGGLAYVAEDGDLDSYLYDELLGERELGALISRQMLGLDLWFQSNFSGYNMVFQAVYLARFVDGAAFRDQVAQSLEYHIYDHETWHQMQPREQKQSLFDFVYAAGTAGASAFAPMTGQPDPVAVANGVETLMGFPEAPYWEYETINCDEAEIASGNCELLDGTQVRVLGEIGRNETLIVNKPVPMATRHASNYWWRSNPYGPNGGGNGSNMMPGVDFRWAYWLGRWLR